MDNPLGHTETYSAGDLVRVSYDSGIMEHVRTPLYIQGKCGTIVKSHGKFANPEKLAYGLQYSPKVHLYMVEFYLENIWTTAHTNASHDSICLDLFEHWLTSI